MRALSLLAASDLLPAREQMAFTLGFHIVLSCLGIALPAITLIANWRGIRGDDDALKLARRWSKVMAVLFAVGAVTGTVLSFELGLLWPRLMGRFGDVFGIGFAIEGLFFFTEAIFIAIYIYGWERLSPRAHFWTGVPIVIAGIGGALSVVAANSWMNQPAGFTLDRAGHVVDVRPVEVLFNGATPYEVPHMILAAYMVAGFLLASVYAVGMLRGRRDRYHRIGFVIPFTVAAIATPVQLFVGDTAARAIAEDQPAKFAAMEYVTETGANQPEYIGGFYDDGDVKAGIKIPDLDSILVGFSSGKIVTGLDQIPDDEQPPAPTLLHLSFDTMVGIGTALLLLGVWFAVVWWRRRELPRTVWFLRAAAVAGVAAIAALECGWVVTEVGRQPWIVHGYLRTEDAVTTAGGIWWTLAGTLLLYTALGVTTVVVLRGMARRWREEEIPEEDIPYGPQ
ncbi:MAG TPA: cytochrome ubiquinol oxidase subunit I [Thermoleophilaceae bacterium]